MHHGDKTDKWGFASRKKEQLHFFKESAKIKANFYIND